MDSVSRYLSPIQEDRLCDLHMRLVQLERTIGNMKAYPIGNDQRLVYAPRFFLMFLPVEQCDAMAGDLHEKYAKDVDRLDRRRAALRFWETGHHVAYTAGMGGAEAHLRPGSDPQEDWAVRDRRSDALEDWCF
jgi:hypothetical protein